MAYFEENLEKQIETPGGKLVQVFGDKENANVSVALVRMSKAKQGVRHYHDNITEIYFFAYGEGEIIINGNVNEVQKGDLFIIPPKNIHLIKAKTDMNFICICTPPWKEEHEFVTEEEINSGNIFKSNMLGNILKLSEKNEHVIKINLINNSTYIPSKDSLNYTKVYFIGKGNGKIIINDEIIDVFEGECYLVRPNDKVEIISKEELKFIEVNDIINYDIR